MLGYKALCMATCRELSHLFLVKDIFHAFIREVKEIRRRLISKLHCPCRLDLTPRRRRVLLPVLVSSIASLAKVE